MSESENTEKRWGVAHVHASFNNTLITVTDLTGAETIVKSSGGAVVNRIAMRHHHMQPCRWLSLLLRISKQQALTVFMSVSAVLAETGIKALDQVHRRQSVHLLVPVLRSVESKTSHQFHTMEHVHQRTAGFNH
jgi:SSU ribosomal protein S11P